MNYNNYSTEDFSVREAGESNGSRHTYGCGKADVYDWLSEIAIPPDYKVCNIIEIKFKGSRKEFYLNPKNTNFKNGDLVVVEGNMGGHDVGHVSLSGELVSMQLRKKNVSMENVVKKIYRLATPADETIWKLAKELELNTLYKARDLAKKLGLAMKLSDVDYQGDKTKATFYYTAEGRVDYRELIQQLSKTFQVRIDMRQIGLREEASRIGNIGPCGSFFCCHTWSTNFKTDSPFSTRYQNNYKRHNNKYECYINDERENKDSNSENLKAQEDIKSIAAKALVFVDVVGQDSISRFDNKGNKSKNTNRKNKNRKPQ